MKQKTSLRKEHGLVKEYGLVKERRSRYLKNLIEETILNVLHEQEAVGQTQQTQQTEPLPPPVATPGNQAQNNIEVRPNYSVDDLIEALNVIRGGRSFSDPEVYGRLVTFFKNTNEDQRVVLETMLSQIAELVTGIETDEAEQDINAQGNSSSQNGSPQSPPGSGAPQQSAPMPGAQTAVGAAGVGAA